MSGHVLCSYFGERGEQLLAQLKEAGLKLSSHPHQPLKKGEELFFVSLETAQACGNTKGRVPVHVNPNDIVSTRSNLARAIRQARKLVIR